jgi:hypothetical protein
VPDVTMFQGNLSPSVSDTIKVGGVPFDLTGSSVKFCMRLRSSSTLKVNVAAVIVSPTAGTVRYDWSGTDTDTAGEYVGYWSVTLPGGKVQDTPEFAVYVQAHSLSTSNLALCSVQDVRDLVEINSTLDASRDPKIASLIPRASHMILQFCDRQFVPQEVNTIHTFPADYLVDLAPWDLRTGPNGTTNPTVSLNPEDGAGAIALTAGTDFALEPVENPEGVYKRLRITGLRVLLSSFQTNFGYAKVSVTADWGFAAIPLDVNMACARTVATWLSPRVASYGADDVSGDPSAGLPIGSSTWDLPRSVKVSLRQYRRSVF